MGTFAQLNLRNELLEQLQALAYLTPTAIQEAAIPAILDGADVAGQAETGSGKTAAYGLPLLHRLDANLEQVQALIVVPTRELALQVRQELKQFAKLMPNLKISSFYGGHAFSQERASLAHPPQVLVGTPGRLTDHLNRNTLNLAHVQQLVLDEADKLLEMGFEEELDQVIAALPRKRQTILFSATMPEGVKELISASLKAPKFIKATATTVPDQVKFVGLKVEQADRQEVLVKLLQQQSGSGTVVFTNTRAATDEVTAFVQAHGLSVKALHGGMEQRDRDQTMTLFRNGSVAILVATDVAARGLDIDALHAIIHYELPDDKAAYLHRSGRTGRAGRNGTVYTLATPKGEQKLRDWELVRMDEWLDAGTLSAAHTQQASEPRFATIYIQAGRKDKISPRDIVGALIAEAGLEAGQIGKIEVQDKSSYVAVPEKESREIVKLLSNGKIKGRKFRVSLVQ
ncbi:DEAD/DEAH box helicase [Pontibacter sp. SGAir0037]|uniref:DEAD/DEAH box helicase n=1 Tax=Pontibacter sp. SGAir0037 TaxID=2571030 RepID=UPI0010CD1F01|nr:DEAD/DEAH box helicase [Pontibacter sp. SGAir0037]QCR22010.1 ATP-dependent RNA helicase [Pontibacter sp. SGAir0037]